MSTKNKKDIIFGNFELDADEFSPQNVKARITTLVDEDALEEFKKIAEARGIKYQTLLNQVIRGFVAGSKGGKGSKGGLTEESVRQIVREELRKRA
jgi:predicted DNA binding CopG/RHH family protein